MNFIAPSSGAPYVGFYNGGNLVSGAGGLKTQGNVTITGAAGDPSFTAPVEIVSGAANGSGSFSGAFTIDSGASFKLASTLNLYGDLTIPSGATVDMNGQALQFFGNNKTFSNNGTLANTAALNAFYLLRQRRHRRRHAKPSPARAHTAATPGFAFLTVQRSMSLLQLR